MVSYEFSKHSKSSLENFLKAVNQNQGADCDLEKYNSWKKIVSLQNTQCNNLLTNPDILEVTYKQDIELNTKNLSILSKEPANSNSQYKDFSSLIQEYLQSGENIPESVLKELEAYSDNLLKNLFISLRELNVDQIFLLGCSLYDFSFSTNVVEQFCECILIPKMQLEYNENLEKLFKKSMERNPKIISEQFNFLPNAKNISNYCLYFNKCTTEERTDILRVFLLNCKTLESSHFPLIDCLVKDNVDINIAQNIIELLTNNVEKFITCKEFGKITMTIMQQLGNNIIKFEKSIKHILKVHKSVWRSKLEKLFYSNLENSPLFSQISMN